MFPKLDNRVGSLTSNGGEYEDIDTDGLEGLLVYKIVEIKGEDLVHKSFFYTIHHDIARLFWNIGQYVEVVA